MLLVVDEVEVAVEDVAELDVAELVDDVDVDVVVVIVVGG